MRTKIFWTIFVTFLFSIFLTVAEDSGGLTPGPIMGIITIEGERVDALQVTLENLVTHETLSWHTRYGGELVGDMSEFRQGVKSGTNFKVTYCIQDSRCNQVFKYLPGYSGGWISHDLARRYGGSSSPFSVFGTVTEAGELLDDVSVTLKNFDKGYEKTVSTNGDGEFVFNLANIGVYDTGDRITVSYDIHSSSGLVSNVGFLDLSIAIRTPPAETPPQEDGGDGGSNRGDQGEVTKPEGDEPEEIQEPEVVPEETPDDTIVDTPPSIQDEPSKGWVWVLIIVIVVVIGLGYWFMKEG